MPDTGTGVAGALPSLLGDEPLEGEAAGLLVGTASHAAARRGARHRADADGPAHGPEPGHGGLVAPDAGLLPRHDHAAAVTVVLAAGRAVVRLAVRAVAVVGATGDSA